MPNQDSPRETDRNSPSNTQVQQENITNKNAGRSQGKKPRKRKSDPTDSMKSPTKYSILNYFESKENNYLNGAAVTPKVDAFQFMMGSRNKSLGRNSPGKTVNGEDCVEESVGKSVMSARKNLLQRWADAKGGAKRKREYEETGNCIEFKLEERAKKLKKLLKIDDEEEVVEDKTIKGVLVIDSREQVTVKAVEVDINESAKKHKKKKNKNRLSLTKNAEEEEIFEEKPDSVRSPKRNWKLRIKLNLDSAEDGTTNNCKENVEEKSVNEERTVEDKNTSNKYSDFIKDTEKNASLTITDDVFDKIYVEEATEEKEEPKKKSVRKKKNLKKQKKIVKNEEPENSNRLGVKNVKVTDEDSTTKSRLKIAPIFLVTRNKDSEKSDIPDDESTKETEEPPDNFNKKSVQKKNFKRAKKFNKNEDNFDKFQTMNKRNKPPKTAKKKSKNRKLIIEDSASSLKEKKRTPESSDDSVIICDDSPDERNVEEAVTKAKEESEDVSSENRRVLRVRKLKVQSPVYDSLSSDDSSEDEVIKKRRKNAKVAPVFLKAIPKPKEDPKVVEARRQFLLSGVPSSVKKEMVKQQSNEEIDFDVFPAISHVQQKNEAEFWNLPKINLQLATEEETCNFSSTTQLFNILKIDYVERDEKFCKNNEEEMEFNKNQDCRKAIKEIKLQNPDYPVFKCYKTISTNSGYNKTLNNEEKKQATPKNKRGRPAKKSKSSASEDSTKLSPESISENLAIHSMWTEKYKPKSSSEIVGNYKSISSLKRWLTAFMNASSKTKVIAKNYDSESEFDTTDGDSRDSSKAVGNTVVVKGPNGCGKSAAVYAVCQELGFEVLEVNASSKRTGRWLLQELQEATQSHQVRKKGNSLVRAETPPQQMTNLNKKMCVLLVEDIDLVFEQDEGFIPALAQISSTSKRPVILTTTDERSTFVKKFLDQHQVFTFSPLSPAILGTWLQIVCLVEGVHVDCRSVQEVLEFNRGDVRKTLLELQFWVKSGGGCREMSVVSRKTGDEVNGNIDDETNDSGYRFHIHTDCLKSFEVIKKSQKTFMVADFLNLEILWWNLTKLFELPDFSDFRLNKNAEEAKKENFIETDNNKVKEKEKLTDLCEFYNNLSLTDVFRGKNKNAHDSLERVYFSSFKDGLELDERMLHYEDRSLLDLSDFLITKSVEEYTRKNCHGSSFSSKINIAVPQRAERRWYSKQIASEETLAEALPVGVILEKKSVALDYLPCLRNIARSELKRAASNTKRGNRFYNYMKTLGVNCGDSVYKTSCNIFNVPEQR